MLYTFTPKSKFEYFEVESHRCFLYRYEYYLRAGNILINLGIDIKYGTSQAPEKVCYIGITFSISKEMEHLVCERFLSKNGNPLETWLFYNFTGSS